MRLAEPSGSVISAARVVQGAECQTGRFGPQSTSRPLTVRASDSRGDVGSRLTDGGRKALIEAAESEVDTGVLAAGLVVGPDFAVASRGTEAANGFPGPLWLSFLDGPARLASVMPHGARSCHVKLRRPVAGRLGGDLMMSMANACLSDSLAFHSFIKQLSVFLCKHNKHKPYRPSLTTRLKQDKQRC